MEPPPPPCQQEILVDYTIRPPILTLCLITRVGRVVAERKLRQGIDRFSVILQLRLLLCRNSNSRVILAQENNKHTTVGRVIKRQLITIR